MRLSVASCLACLLAALTVQWVARRAPWLRDQWQLAARFDQALTTLDEALAESAWDRAYAAWRDALRISPDIALTSSAHDRLSLLNDALVEHSGSSAGLLAALRRTTLRTAAVLAGSKEAEEMLLQALKEKSISPLAEELIWEFWCRSGHAGADAALQRGIRQLSSPDLMEDALETFKALTRSHPDFVEAWNKRATANFLLGRYEESLKDCAVVLSTQPKHFGALSGSGLVHMELWKRAQPQPGEQQGESIVAGHLRRGTEQESAQRHLRLAHDAFSEALAVHPYMSSVKKNLRVAASLLGADGTRRSV